MVNALRVRFWKFIITWLWHAGISIKPVTHDFDPILSELRFI